MKPVAALPIALAVLTASAAAQDTVVVRAENPPVWGESPELVEELRIGSLDGREEYSLGSVRYLAPGPDGSVYVVDGRIPVVRHYDAEGRWLGDVGREGEGPGEYLRPMGLSNLPGGSLTLYDYRSRRVTVYDESGELSSSFNTTSGLASANTFAVDTSGVVWIRNVDNDGKPIPPGQEWPFIWIRHGADGSILDSVRVPPEDDVGGGWVLAGYGGFFRPFTVTTETAVSPHGYLVEARNDRYAIHRPLPDGRVLRIERDAEPVPLLPEEKAEWEAWREFMESRGRGRSYDPIPDHKPIIRHLFVDAEARIWVARYAEAVHRPEPEHVKAERREEGSPSRDWRQPLVWDVLDPRGTFLGSVTLPFNTTLAATRGDLVWGIHGGEFREPYVIRYRIRKPRPD